MRGNHECPRYTQRSLSGRGRDGRRRRWGRAPPWSRKTHRPVAHRPGEACLIAGEAEDFVAFLVDLSLSFIEDLYHVASPLGAPVFLISPIGLIRPIRPIESVPVLYITSSKLSSGAAIIGAQRPLRRAEPSELPPSQKPLFHCSAPIYITSSKLSSGASRSWRSSSALRIFSSRRRAPR